MKAARYEESSEDASCILNSIPVKDKVAQANSQAQQVTPAQRDAQMIGAAKKKAKKHTRFAKTPEQMAIMKDMAWTLTKNGLSCYQSYWPQVETDLQMDL